MQRSSLSMPLLRGTVKALCVASLLSATAASQATLIGLSSGRSGLYDINSTTGAATLITPVASLGGSFVGLEYLGGKLYATNLCDAKCYTFGTIDMTTGAYTALNKQEGSANWSGLAGNEALQLLYTIDGSDGSKLKSITTAGLISTIGATAPSIGGGGMAYDDANGILYATGDGSLWRVNTSTAAATLIGALGINAANIGLAYDEDSRTLFANSAEGLFTVNTSTGAATFVGNNGTLGAGAKFIDGLAWAPVPEPGTLALLGLGLAGLAASPRRKQ